MRLLVKHLQGKGVEIDIDDDASLNALKSRVEEEIGVPSLSQKLVYKGKVLQNDRSLSKQGLTDQSKVFLSGKVAMSTRKPSEEVDAPETSHLEPLREFLRRYYSETDAAKITQRFQEAIKSTVDLMSLDDIERFAQAT
ncbi:uncharacterized protein [Oscarella lobularis]|uniref:uncharacterized protein n=1 Tax=Oscarella lobularis TaxID=121494 RepID=UPI0033142EDC